VAAVEVTGVSTPTGSPRRPSSNAKISARSAASLRVSWLVRLSPTARVQTGAR